MNTRPRILEHAAARDVLRRIPATGLRAALAGLEAALVTWVVISIVTIAAYVATAADAALGAAGWFDALQAGSAVWALAHGGGLRIGDAELSVVPIGLTLAAMAMMAGSMRRAASSQPWALAWAVAAYGLTAAVIVAISGRSSGWAVAGALAVSALGSLWGIRKGWPWQEKLRERLPLPVIFSLKLGVWLTLGYLTAGLLAVIAMVVVNRADVAELHHFLTNDAMSTILLILAQAVLLVPVMALWAVAYIAGPGFSVGTATIFAPGEISSGALPAVPLLAALPAPQSVLGEIPYLIVVSVVVGGGIGLILHRRGDGLGRTLAALGTTIMVATGIMAVLTALASGSVGPGRMTETGAAALGVAVSLAWQWLLGGLLVVVGLNRDTWAFARSVRNWGRTWRSEVTGSTESGHTTPETSDTSG